MPKPNRSQSKRGIPAWRVLALPLALAVLSGVAGGCAGYRLGPTNGLAAGERSIRIESLQNETIEPRLAEALNTSLRRQLQQDGSFRLETRGPGDVVLRGTIVRYERSGLTFNPQDLYTARDFQVSMTAHVVAIEQDSGRVLLDRQVTGKTTVRSDQDLTSAERQALPLLAEDLARNTVSLLVDGEW